MEFAEFRDHVIEMMARYMDAALRPEALQCGYTPKMVADVHQFVAAVDEMKTRWPDGDVP